MIKSISRIMEYETAGDPMTGLLWTKKTREKISKELAKLEIHVGETTAGKLLKSMKFSLKTNRKQISNGGKKPTKEQREARDQQFRYIESERRRCCQENIALLSVDTKKKETLGNFKNPGTRYKKEADLTNDHDFISYGIGKAFPYGLYGLERNEGFFYVGQSLYNHGEKRFESSETPEFGAENVARWWRDYGVKLYPNCHELFILADAGGSNGCHSRMWKYKLYELLCKPYGLKVTACHYPPGASKWNPIEHRLFSEVSKNWQGTPLKSFETVLKYLRTTRTKTGLSVRARLVTKKYKKGKKVSVKDFKKINLQLHQVLPNWNYSILPPDR